MRLKNIFLGLALIISQHAWPQQLLDRINNFKNRIPSSSKLIMGEEPLTTSLNGAVYEVPSMDNFEPDNLLPADELPRYADGSFFMVPGVWEFNLKSYCLKAGTYGPSRSNGLGYVYAPLEGPKADIIRSILSNSAKYPDIPQRDIQVLLWGIIARQNIKDMPAKYMVIAGLLLDPKELLRLNDGVVRNFVKKEFDDLLEKSPPAVREVMEAENKMRELMTDANTQYEELERVAVMTGIMPQDDGRSIVRGRWSSTPQGYYIRYFPSSYSQMNLQVYVPENAYMQMSYLPVSRSGKSALLPLTMMQYLKLKEFNPAEHPAVPPRRGQRLGSSNQKNPDPDKRDDALDRANKILKAKSNAETGYGLATDPLGTVLGKINPFTPDNMFDNILEFITENGRKISDALNGDPPDPNYTEIERPKEIDLDKLSLKKFDDPALNKKSNQFLNANLKAYAYMIALVRSNDKLGGAVKVKDKFWSNRQAWAIMYYKNKLGVALLESCDKWEEYLNALRSTYQKIPMRPENVARYQEKLRREGFSSREMDAFSLLGLSQSEIDEVRNKRLSYDPDQFRGDYIEKSSELINAWRTIGNRYAKFPALPAPWE